MLNPQSAAEAGLQLQVQPRNCCFPAGRGRRGSGTKCLWGGSQEDGEPISIRRVSPTVTPGTSTEEVWTNWAGCFYPALSTILKLLGSERHHLSQHRTVIIMSFYEYLLCARHRAKGFTGIFSLSLHETSMRWILLLFPSSRQGDCGLQRPTGLPKVTWLVGGTAEQEPRQT